MQSQVEKAIGELQLLKQKSICEEQVQKITSLKESLQSLQSQINKIFEDSISLVNRQISIYDNLGNYFTHLFLDPRLLANKNSLSQNNNQLVDYFTNLSEKFKKQFKDQQITEKCQQIVQLIENIDQVYESKLNQSFLQQQEIESNKDNNNFNYQLVTSFQFQSDWSYTFAFNSNNTILINNRKEKIIVYDFSEEKFNEIQTLIGHSSDVYILQFMKKTNEFVSASTDSTIIIWVQNKKWQFQQVLKGHNKAIYALIINTNEDLLISGSQDQTIKFWEKASSKWIMKQSIDFESRVFSLSLSPSQDKLIASLEGNEIKIMQLFDEWAVIQIIKVVQFGQRISFINDFQFVFQPKGGQHFEIYSLDFHTYSIINKEEVKYQNAQYQQKDDGYCLFQIRYIQEKDLLLIKNSNHINFIEVRKEQRKLIIRNEIFFDTPVLYGNISDDGKYIVIWDSYTRTIRILKQFP